MPGIVQALRNLIKSPADWLALEASLVALRDRNSDAHPLWSQLVDAAGLKDNCVTPRNRAAVNAWLGTQANHLQWLLSERADLPYLSLTERLNTLAHTESVERMLSYFEPGSMAGDPTLRLLLTKLINSQCDGSEWCCLHPIEEGVDFEPALSALDRLTEVWTRTLRH